jgi:hypothetical protein
MLSHTAALEIHDDDLPATREELSFQRLDATAQHFETSKPRIEDRIRTQDGIEAGEQIGGNRDTRDVFHPGSLSRLSSR